AADIWRARVRDGRAAREEEPVPLAASTASMRAVARALEDPSPVAVEQALAAIDASPDQDLFDAQTVLARGAARRGGLGGAALALAERLGVAPDAGGGGLVRGGPLRFVLALHLHQPVGNFDHVFRAHVEGVYAPL